MSRQIGPPPVAFRQALTRRKLECDKGFKASEGSRPVGRDDIQRRVDAVRAAAQRAREPHHRRVPRRLHRPPRVHPPRHRGRDVAADASSFLAPRAAAGRRRRTAATAASQANKAEVTTGGTIRVGPQRPGSDLDPIMVNNQGALATLSQSGEFLIYSDRELKPMPRLAESWKPNARRLAVDVQDPPGRQVPGRQADDRGGRRGDVQPARRPRQRLQRALGVHRRALEGRRPGDRRDDGGVRARRRRTATSRSRPPRTTTT